MRRGNRRRASDGIPFMLDLTPPSTYAHTVIHDLPLGLSLQLWLVDGELSGALWLFCLCEAGVGEA
ncbi:hypothetical protein [Sorangium sp. So ce513]|uniref:hypothetical protein n=1 Tax=Sorangium sp. So ce513 TaxID=3133315 RepID=UPI003F5E4BEC